MDKNRLHVIDGVRGWAAFSVLLFHVFCETFSMLKPEFRSVFTHFIFNGPLAIAVFFVLSGDALSTGYLKNQKLRTIDSLLLKRYFRLTIPIFMSCLIVYLLMEAGLMFNVEAAPIVHREGWLGSFIPFQPSIITLFRYSFYQVYDSFSNSASFSPLSISYNPFLWTMSIEFIGSMLVFLFLYVSNRLVSPIKLLIPIIVFLFLEKSYYALFFVGVLFANYRISGVFTKLLINKAWQIATIIIILALIIIDTQLRFFISQGHVNIVISSALVFCIYSSNLCVSVFSCRISRILGKLSFPLYLIHFSVIASLTSFLIIKYSDTLDSYHIYLISFISILASVLGATLFYFVEDYLLFHVNKIPRLLLKSNYE